MSKIIPIVAILVSLAFADTLYLKDGREIKDAIIAKINDTEVEYKIGKRETVYTAKKSSIASILYDDGTEDVFEPKPKEEPSAPVAAAKDYESEKAEEKNGIRFGARINVGNATTGLSVQTTGGATEAVGGDITGGAGAFALIPFMSIYFVPEISLQHRKPIAGFSGMTSAYRVFSDLTLTETAIDIPLMFRFRYREENLIYLGVGPLLGIVLTSYYDDMGKEVLNEGREKIDYGLAFELGFRINENFSIDLRGLYSLASIGFTEYVGIGGETGTLMQGQLGVSYAF